MPRPRSDIAPRIVHAARARFLTEGVDGASLRQIANDAGTSIGMIYYYFPTKDDLFLAVVEEVYAGLLADLSAALAPAKQRPVTERLAGLYQRLGALSPDELLVLRIVVREVLAQPARLESLVERFRRGHLPLIITLVQDAYAEGLFDPAVPPLLAALTMMMLGGPAQAILHTLRDRLPLPPLPARTDVATTLTEILLHGIGPRTGGKTQPASTPRPKRRG